MPYEALVYVWPECQICQGCCHADNIVSVDGDDTPRSICLIYCDKNDGVECPEFEEV